MQRITIERTIHTTALGATYECSVHTPQLTTRRASVVLKSSSLAVHKRLLTTLTDRDRSTLDDPLHERDVVAALIASVGHDNVLQCYNHFITTDNTTGEDHVCLVTEYCNGGDLFTHLQASTASGGLSERESRSILRQVARGVLFLQSRLGLAHRDLSLENILLRDGVCKVADFGVATPLNQKCYGRVGKLAYMAPEVVDSQAHGYDPAAADVWSLGIMLFILLTGSSLVDIASLEDKRFNVLARHGVGAIIAVWGVELSQDAAALLDAMLQVDPTNRPTVAHVLLRLNQLSDVGARQ